MKPNELEYNDENSSQHSQSPHIKYNSSTASINTSHAKTKKILTGDSFTIGVDASIKESMRLLEKLSADKGSKAINRATLKTQINNVQTVADKITLDNNEKTMQLSKISTKIKEIEKENEKLTQIISTLQEDKRKKAINIESNCVGLEKEISSAKYSNQKKKDEIALYVESKKKLRKSYIEESNNTETLLLEMDKKILEFKRQCKKQVAIEDSREKYLSTQLHLVETLLDGGRLDKIAYSPDKKQKM